MTDAPNTNPTASFDRVATLGIASSFGVLLVLISVTRGIAATIAVVLLLVAIDVVGALIWTCAQQIVGRPTVPFGTRFLRNTRDFYIRLLAVVLP